MTAAELAEIAVKLAAQSPDAEVVILPSGTTSAETIDLVRLATYYAPTGATGYYYTNKTPMSRSAKERHPVTVLAIEG